MYLNYLNRLPTMKKLLIAALVIAISGCASTRDKFYTNKYALRDSTICNAYFANISGTDYQLTGDLKDELDRRRITPDMCRGLIDEQNQINAIALSNAANSVVAGVAVSNAINNQNLVPAPQATIFLQGQQINGNFRYCKYSNGMVQTFSIGSVCPFSY